MNIKKNIENYLLRRFEKLYSIKSYREFPFSFIHPISQNHVDVSILCCHRIDSKPVSNDLVRYFYTV